MVSVKEGDNRNIVEIFSIVRVDIKNDIYNVCLQVEQLKKQYHKRIGGTMEQRKIPALVLTLAITIGILSGCQNMSSTTTATLNMDIVSKANTVAHLLENYKTVTYAQLDYIGGDTMHMTYFKDKNGNCCAAEDDSGYTGYQTDSFTFSREKGESKYILSATKDANVSDFLFMVSDSKFTSQTTDSRGNLVCETQADIDQDFANQLSKTWSATTEDKMVTTTILAPDDFRVLSINFRLCRPDGSEFPIASGVMLYDKEVKYTDAVQSYLDAEKWTVSVQMPDGSRRTGLIPKGETFSWDCDEGFALYEDAEGKMLISKEFLSAEKNMALYVMKVQN